VSPVALKTVVAGGVVYPAGAAVPDDVADGISAAGVFQVDDTAAEATVGDWASNLSAASVEEIAAAAAALGLVLTPADQVDTENDEDAGTDQAEADALAAALPAPEDEDEDEGAAASIDYSAWSVDQLKEEISTRNSYREADAQLSTKGKKADLAAVLTADDEA
jgi:hypothetical protein